VQGYRRHRAGARHGAPGQAADGKSSTMGGTFAVSLLMCDCQPTPKPLRCPPLLSSSLCHPRCVYPLYHSRLRGDVTVH
jgi:hypothetical protein